MRKKRIFLLGMLVPTIFINIPKVNAFEFDVSFASTGNYQEKPNDNNNKESGYKEEWTEGNVNYTCNYDYEASTNNRVVINGYDRFDNPILTNSLVLSDEDRIVSGTSIGLSIYEKKTVAWKVTKAEVTAQRTKTTTKYTCKYKIDKKHPTYTCKIVNGTPICSDTAGCNNITKTGNGSCPSVDKCVVDYSKTTSNKTTTNQEIPTSAESQKKCKTIAIEAAVKAANAGVYPSYEIELTDSNDVYGSNKIKITKNKAENTGTITKKCDLARSSNCKFQGNSSLEEYINKMYDNNLNEDQFTTNFIYKNQRTCMNSKTSKVTYNKSNCSDDEIEITNTGTGTNEHWHYFVPLNAKSNSEDVKIKMISGSTINNNKCLYVIATNPKYKVNGQLQDTYYKDLIVKSDDSEFKGDAKCKWIANKVVCENEETSSDLLYLKNNQCKLNTTISFNVVQKFYNEVTSDDTKTIKFHGFNFYYKPIDINNPFPNGITDNSLWKDSEKSMDDSYAIKTYEAINISAIKIREYNKKNSYTDWTTMDVDGTSDFIESNDMVIRNVKKDSFYKLGCGPANSNPNSTLYIKGCELK